MSKQTRDRAAKVPIIKSAITHLREHHFKEPAIIPIDVVIGVRDIATVANDTMNGKCLRLTPPELLLAYFEAAAMTSRLGMRPGFNRG